jgi:hypothetical protein
VAAIPWLRIGLPQGGARGAGCVEQERKGACPSQVIHQRLRCNMSNKRSCGARCPPCCRPGGSGRRSHRWFSGKFPRRRVRQPSRAVPAPTSGWHARPLVVALPRRFCGCCVQTRSGDFYRTDADIGMAFSSAAPVGAGLEFGTRCWPMYQPRLLWTMSASTVPWFGRMHVLRQRPVATQLLRRRIVRVAVLVARFTR